jgi:hypothetical protein
LINTDTQPDHAVICAAHAVYTAGDVFLDSSWVLQLFQHGEPRYYVEHLRRAIGLTAADESALLVLSGGRTRAEAGPRSEAQGYFDIAEKLGWFGHPEVRARTLLEEFSRDSLENLLFGICRYKQAAGIHPRRTTIVSWAFKQQRFDFHRATLGLPSDGFVFEGVENPPDLGAALAGEQRTLDEFRRDPFGEGELLAAKRKQRNPFQNQHDFHSVCPEFARFLGTMRLHPSRASDIEPRRS